MDCFGAVLVFDNLVGFQESLFNISHSEFEIIGDVGRLFSLSPAAGPERRTVHCQQTFVEDWSVIFGRILSVHDRC